MTTDDTSIEIPGADDRDVIRLETEDDSLWLTLAIGDSLMTTVQLDNTSVTGLIDELTHWRKEGALR